MDDEREMEEMIEKFWGDLFCVIGKAKYGIMKELVVGGMVNERWNISDLELRRAIKMMKENKTTDESGMIAEYLKGLGERDVHNQRMLLNEVLSGGCIPNEWRESRVVLVHKGGSKKEL